MKTFLLSSVAVLGLSLPAMAQSEFATGANITGATAINDRIDDARDDVYDDFARSEDVNRRYQNRHEGLGGGMTLSFTGNSGNSESQNLTLGGRVTHSNGPLTQSTGLILEYGKDDDGDDETKDALATYDATYDFSPRLYGFVLGRVSVDGMVSDDLDALADGTLDGETAADLDGRVKRDAFVGVGPGYRILDNPSTTWRVQGGVGLRYTESVDLGAGGDGLVSDTSDAYIVSSRVWHEFNDKIYVTNDTDYLDSDANETITNELGLNYKFTDMVVGRASYQTEYVSDRAERTDNKLAMSVGLQF